MAYAIALVFGAVGAGLWIAGVRWIGRGEPWWFALGLVVAAAIYLTHRLGFDLVVATYLLSRPTRPASTDQLVGP